MMDDSRLLKILVVINIFLVFSLLTLLIYALKIDQKKIAKEVLGKQDIVKEDITIEEEKQEDFTVSICIKSDCVWISSKGLVKDGVVDVNIVYQKVLDIVLPYFEQRYGGKAMVRNRSGSYIYWKNDIIPNFHNIFERVVEAFKGGKDVTVELTLNDLPSTDGRYSDRYIEIDNSKQKLYAWVDGIVQKEILLSAAKSGYEVYGVFPIIDKGIAPIAPSGRYMPYWMAFYYSPKQDTYYGLHALIWWYDENGKKIYEPNSNIGIRRSRGCIRMLLEDAKYLYDIYRKGDPVLIHE